MMDQIKQLECRLFLAEHRMLESVADMALKTGDLELVNKILNLKKKGDGT
jgi:hypothetical protein